MIHQLDPKMLACVLPEGAKDIRISHLWQDPQAIEYLLPNKVGREIPYVRELPPGRWQIVGMASEVAWLADYCLELVEEKFIDGVRVYRDYTVKEYPYYWLGKDWNITTSF